MADNLLDDLKKSMMDMQQQMQNTYVGLENVEAHGECDGVSITLTCTYKFVDIDILPQAMQGGLKEFKYRIRQAFTIACEEVQKMTQSKTMELLQGMNIPEEIRNLTATQLPKNDKDNTGS